jgi:hypothetical protein
LELNYSDIKAWITAAKQPERDALKTDRWKTFFVSVCTNKTMKEALDDLGFDLETKLTWIQAEMTFVSWELDYPDIKAWITAAPQAERDALKTDRWKAFFVDVCTNDTIVDAVNDLNFDLVTKLNWLLAEGCVYKQFKLVITAAPDKAVALADKALLRSLKDDLPWDDFAKCVELLGLIIPAGATLVADPSVQAALATAWAACNAALTCGGGPTTAHEEGGWIYLDIITGSTSTRSAVAGAQASIDLWNPPEVPDSVVVATFHVHPNVGPCWGAPFLSPADVTNANKRGVPNIVRGAFPAVANISDVSGGPAKRLHLAGPKPFPGAGGGLNPQAPLNKEFDFE